VKVAIRYDLGEGEQVRRIGPQALVGWELASKQRMSDLANGFGIGDMVTMLFEQMKADGDAPVTRGDLLRSLVDISPENDQDADPQSLDAEASPEPLSS